METVFTTPAELLEYLWRKFDLDHRTISFSRFDVCDRKVHYTGGLMECATDIEEDSRFYDVVSQWEEEPIFCSVDITAYQLGTGESNAATDKELEMLERIANESPGMMEDMLYEYADQLACFSCDIDNPAYEEPDEEEED